MENNNNTANAAAPAVVAAAAPAANVDNNNLTTLGSLREYAKKNGYQVNLNVVESKASGYPSIWMRKDGVVTGIVLSKKAGAKYPIDSAIDADNVYVQQITEEGNEEVRLIITTGSNIVWSTL